MNKKISVVLFIALVTISLIFDKGAAYGFTVSPTKIELSLASKGAYTGAFTIRNTEKYTLSVSARIEDRRKAVEGKYAEADEADNFDWLTLKLPSSELKPDEAGDIIFSVEVPEGAVGELNAMIFIEAKPKEADVGAIGINTSIGVPIYVMVAGTELFQAEIGDIQLKSSSPLELYVTVKNSGNVHIRPEGNIAIKTKEGKGLFKVPLNEYSYPVLPDSSRELEVRSEKMLETGEYIIEIEMESGDKIYKKSKEVQVF